VPNFLHVRTHLHTYVSSAYASYVCRTWVRKQGVTLACCCGEGYQIPHDVQTEADLWELAGLLIHGQVVLGHLVTKVRIAHESGVVVTHADPEVLVLALVDLEDLFDDLFKRDRLGGGRDLEGGLVGLFLLRAAPEYLAFAGCIVAPCLFGRHHATKSSNAVKTNGF
jgi:hypothetical protein